jgi:hypothetical protein
VIIGVTNEKESLVDAWVAKNNPGYPIVILANEEIENALQVRAFPAAGVVDSKGMITYAGSGHGYSSALKKALSKATKGTVIPKALDKVSKALDDNEVGLAYDLLADHLSSGKLEGKDLSMARKLSTYLESEAEEALEDAKEDLADGWIYRAHELIRGQAESKTGFPNAVELQAMIVEIKGATGFEAEMKGGKMYAEVESLLTELEYVKAVKSYRQIYSKYKESAIAEHARSAAAKLVDDRMTGMKDSCQKCSRKGRACSKHFEDVKL